MIKTQYTLNDLDKILKLPKLEIIVPKTIEI